MCTINEIHTCLKTICKRMCTCSRCSHIHSYSLLCYIHYLLDTLIDLSLCTSHRVHRSKQVCVVVVTVQLCCALCACFSSNVKRMRTGNTLHVYVTIIERPLLSLSSYTHAQRLPFLFCDSCCCCCLRLLLPLPAVVDVFVVVVSSMRSPLLIHFCTFSYRLYISEPSSPSSTSCSYVIV
jgi:hypothetical protein